MLASPAVPRLPWSAPPPEQPAQKQRAAYWIGPRKAFKQAAIAKVTTHGIEARGVFLEPNDNPHSDTKLYGLDLQWGNDGLGSIGGGFYNIFESRIDTRDGMNVYDIRADLTPLNG